MTSILIIAELFDGRIRPVTYELITAAKKMTHLMSKQAVSTSQIQNRIKIVLLSDTCHELAGDLARKTGMDVIGIEAADLADYTADRYIAHLDMQLRKINPSMIIGAHSSQGRDFAPGLAIRFNASALAGVSDIQSDDHGLVFIRPVLNSTKHMLVRPMADIPVVLTIIPGSFLPEKETRPAPGRVDIQKQSLPKTNQRVTHIKIKKNTVDNQGLKSAEVVVAAGQGIQSKDNLDWVFKLSQCFDKSAVGASRPVIDMGWLTYAHQVGITGASVAPRLYLAFGISGSSQHLAGIKQAKTVISINKNPEAPICQHADLCISEDAIEFIQAFLNA